MARATLLAGRLSSRAGPAPWCLGITGSVLLLCGAAGCREQAAGKVAGAGATCPPGTHLEAPGCVADGSGPRCGDFVTQPALWEECDEGPEPAPASACGPDCRRRCGDGQLAPEAQGLAVSPDGRSMAASNREKATVVRDIATRPTGARSC